jgi:hypothetical protein
LIESPLASLNITDEMNIVPIYHPKEHQCVVTLLIHGLTDLYLKDATRLFTYSKTMIDEGQTSPAPDILLYDHSHEKPMALIEVTHTTGVKKDSEKVKKLLTDYDVEQGFVYDYKKNVWLKFAKGLTQAESSSYCDLIERDLNSFLSPRKNP